MRLKEAYMTQISPCATLSRNDRCVAVEMTDTDGVILNGVKNLLAVGTD